MQTGLPVQPVSPEVLRDLSVALEAQAVLEHEVDHPGNGV